MAKKKGFSPFIATLVLTALCVGALIPSSLAWYSVSTNISVSSSSVLISTADPNYGEFELTRLYIIHPDLGEVNLNQPSQIPQDAILFPVSTLNGQHYYYKYTDGNGGRHAIEYDQGTFQFLAVADYSQMTQGIRLNFYFDVTVPRVGNTEYPHWTRVHVFVYHDYDLNTMTPGQTNYGNTNGYLFIRNDPDIASDIAKDKKPLGLNPSNKAQERVSCSPRNLDVADSVDLPGRTPSYGTMYFLVTLYLEGIYCDQTLSNELSLSMTIIPSRNPSP